MIVLGTETPVAADPLPLGLGPCVTASGQTGCTSGDTNVNTFVGGNLTADNGWSEIGGNTVVMGDFGVRSNSIRNMGVYVGPGIQPQPTGVLLRVGGDLDLEQDVQLTQGQACYAGSYVSAGRLLSSGSIQQDPNAVSAYSGHVAALQRASAVYGAMPTTGTVSGGTFTGTNNPTLEVFEVTRYFTPGAISFANVSPTATILINVRGAPQFSTNPDSTKIASLRVEGHGSADPRRILWNVVGAEVLSVGGGTDEFFGSLLVGDPPRPGRPSMWRTPTAGCSSTGTSPSPGV